MPSDERTKLALEALKKPSGSYRSAVATAVEEVRGFISSHRSLENHTGEAVASELGPFAAGRLDIDRFSILLSDSKPLDPETGKAIEAAFEILREFAAANDAMFVLKLDPGDDVRNAVEEAMARAGRLVGAARLVSAARDGDAVNLADEEIPQLAFEAWTADERRFAPPLVVELDGADLQAGELARFLDEGVKLVLVVRGECSPAPLARLITPGTLVVQTADEQGLEQVGDTDGPAVAALVPETAARFIHAPGSGTAPWERIEIWHMPEEPPRKAVGGLSASQQRQDLEQLRALALAGPKAAPAIAASQAEDGAGELKPPGPQPGPADKLAAWMLSQADLSNLD